MTLSDLQTLVPQIENQLRKTFTSHSIRVSVDFLDSPNPVCFFEVEGRFFVQGSFWLNNEFRIEAMDTHKGEALVEQSGRYLSFSGAVYLIDSLCLSANSVTRSR